jgi:hypothetical protein
MVAMNKYSTVTMHNRVFTTRRIILNNNASLGCVEYLDTHLIEILCSFEYFEPQYFHYSDLKYFDSNKKQALKQNFPMVLCPKDLFI